MKKCIVICDWILYLCIITLIAYIAAFSMVLTSTIISDNRLVDIKFAILFAYALWRIIIAPVFLVFLVVGRLLDESIRFNPLFLKNRRT